MVEAGIEPRPAEWEEGLLPIELLRHRLLDRSWKLYLYIKDRRSCIKST